MRYHLRTLLTVLALGPIVLAWLWITVHQNYGVAIIVASLVLLPVMLSPLALAVALMARRRYLLDFERRQRQRSGLFSDNWPTSP